MEFKEDTLVTMDDDVMKVPLNNVSNTDWQRRWSLDQRG
jgi:hypothetical protein